MKSLVSRGRGLPASNSCLAADALLEKEEQAESAREKLRALAETNPAAVAQLWDGMHLTAIAKDLHMGMNVPSSRTAITGCADRGCP
jgi:hypothetical protein